MKRLIAMLAALLLACGAATDSEDDRLRLAAATSGDESLPAVLVRGRQWAWDVEYPGQLLEQTLILPVGRPTRLVFESADQHVFRFEVEGTPLRVDVPAEGRVSVRVEPLRPATLRTVCSVDCGPSPNDFAIDVRFVPAAEYDTLIAALDAPPAGTTAASWGRTLYGTQACAACHALRAIAPDLQGLPGRAIPQADGSTITLENDDAFTSFVRESIVSPGAHVTAGFDPIMPTFRLTEHRVDALVAYLRCLVPECSARAECDGACE